MRGGVSQHLVCRQLHMDLRANLPQQPRILRRRRLPHLRQPLQSWARPLRLRRGQRPHLRQPLSQRYLRRHLHSSVPGRLSFGAQHLHFRQQHWKDLHFDLSHRLLRRQLHPPVRNRLPLVAQLLRRLALCHLRVRVPRDRHNQVLCGLFDPDLRVDLSHSIELHADLPRFSAEDMRDRVLGKPVCRSFHGWLRWKVSGKSWPIRAAEHQRMRDRLQCLRKYLGREHHEAVRAGVSGQQLRG